MSEPIPLSEEDIAILELESEAVAGAEEAATELDALAVEAA